MSEWNRQIDSFEGQDRERLLVLYGSMDGMVDKLNRMRAVSGLQVTAILGEFVTPCYNEHVDMWNEWLANFDEKELPTETAVISSAFDQSLDRLKEQLFGLLEDIARRSSAEIPSHSLIHGLKGGLATDSLRRSQEFAHRLHQLDRRLAREFDPGAVARMRRNTWFYRHRGSVTFVLWILILMAVAAVIREVAWLARLALGHFKR